MGERELLLVLGAIVIFGLAVLTTNEFVVGQRDALLQSEYEYFAASLAQSFIEDAKTKAFDVAVINASPSVPSGFTYPLGPAEGETYPHFNDVDDFNGYTSTVSTSRGDFNVSIQVGYIDPSHPDSVVTTKGFYKKMTVTVTNTFLNAPVRASYVFGYVKN